MKKILILSLLILSVFVWGCQSQGSGSDGLSPSADALTGGVVAVPVNSPGDGYISSEDIYCRGKEGFYPEETLVLKNMPVYFVNKNTKDLVITVQKDGTHEFMTTKLIRPGDKGSLTFSEEGKYTFWDTNYAPKGKIVVR